MQVDLTAKNIAGMTLFVLLFGAVCYAAALGDDAGSMLAYIWQLPVFTLQAAGIMSVALLLMYLSQWVRRWHWFDRDGAAVEMGKVRKRVGDQGKELASDAMAVAIQYTGNTIFLAAIVHSFFLMISGSTSGAG